MGLVAAKDSADVATRADVVLMCVTSTGAVEVAVFGPDGVAEAPPFVKVLVDLSTTEAPITVEFANRLMDQAGAPVSGGPAAALSGTLAIMAGGDPIAIEARTPLMTDLAARFTHMGKVGAGQITKMINQVLVLTNYCVLAEALVLAEKGGYRCQQGAGSPGRGTCRFESVESHVPADDR